MPRFYKRKTQGYEFEKLKKAVEDVRNKRLSLAQASKIYSVPRSTIYDRLGKGIVNVPKRGQKCVFTEAQEKQLEEHILNCSQLFNILTANAVRKIGFKFAKAYNVRNNFDRISKMAGKDWYYGFMKRHPNIIVVSNKKLELSVDGAKAFNEAEVLEYCDNRLAQEIIHHVDNTESQNDDGKKISMNKKKRKLDLELASTRRRSTLSRDDDITNGDMQNKKIKEMAPEQYENEKNKSALEELQIQVLKQLGRKTYSGIKKERKGEVFRNVESEPEVTLTAEIVESSDPLEALSVPGPSRYNLYPSYGNTAQDKKAYVTSESVQEMSLSKVARKHPSLQLTTLSSDLDIKEEYSVQDSRRTGEETLADFSIVSQDDVSESDISTDDIILSHFRSKAEFNSDSSVYFKAQSQKRKQKVTTELLFHRYKLKSKREIDRLHKKIRELKASVQKYKRQVYKLQRRCDNVMGEN